MKTFIIISALLNTVLSLPNLHAEWQVWKAKYDKTYQSYTEEKRHLEVWKGSYRYVQEHNAKPGRSFEVELNEFADQEIIKSTHLDISLPKYKYETVQDTLTFAPESWDWRPKGAIGPVKTQGMIGDSQSIVAAECVGSYEEINHGSLVDPSVQEVHDCCVKSGFMNKNIFQCIHNIGGLCSSAYYPSSAGACRNNSCTAVAQVNGGMAVPSGDEQALMVAVYKMPTLAVIDAGEASFQLYRSGVYSDPKCSKTKLDHVIQIVGYGSMNGEDYWICKNSWGTSWGENGYINIARDKNNMCGIATAAMYPV